MDTEKIIEKLIKWLSDPKGREMFKTIVFLILPIVVLLGLRNAARRKSAAKSSTAIKPRVRASTYESPSVSESLKETMAREKKKVEGELREVFGREDSVLARAKKKSISSPAPKKARPAKSAAQNEKKMLQEELLKLFSRR